MSRFAQFIIVLTFCLVQAGCSSKGGSAKPNPTGRVGELGLVIDGRLQSTPAVKYLKEILQQPVSSLPQVEPLFDVTTIPSDVFSAMFRLMRNLIIIEINPECKKETIRYSTNVWANDQAVVHIEVKSDSSLLAFLQLNENKLPSYFLKEERTRYGNYCRNSLSRVLVDTVNKRFNFWLDVPQGYSIVHDSVNFIWLGQEAKQVQQGLFIYSFPLNKVSSLSMQDLLAKHDSVLKVNVKTGHIGAYMTTEYRCQPESKIFEIDQNEVLSVSGLWRVEGDFMGGPFVMVAIPDIKRNRVVVLDGFVYSPEKPNKRNYIRQLEAIMQTYSDKK